MSFSSCILFFNSLAKEVGVDFFMFFRNANKIPTLKNSKSNLLLFNFSHGRWSGLFLFFRKQLKWSTIQYTTFTTTLGFIGLFGQYIAVPILSGWLRLHDSTISLIDAVTRYVCIIVLEFVYKKGLFKT